MSHLLKTVSLLAVGMVLGEGISAYQEFHQAHQERLNFARSDHRPANDFGGLASQQYAKLASLDYQPGRLPIVQVHGGKSTLNPNAWQSNKVIYQRLDDRKRTAGSNTAFLRSRNLANTDLRIQQGVKPTGWHDNQDGQLIYNRGHLIAYSLTAGINRQTGQYQNSAIGDQDNVRNLFTETDFTNQVLQTIYEGKVRQALERGQHVIYQATPIFRSGEGMARGINLQAISTDGRLNFNVYLYNIEPGISFNYQNGIASNDRRMRIPLPPDAETTIKDNPHESDGSLVVSDNYPRPIASHPRTYFRR